MFRLPEAVWLTAVCSTAMTSGEGAEAFNLEEGRDAEASGVDKIVFFRLGEASMLPCIARELTTFSEEAGMWRFSEEVSRRGEEILSSGSGASVRLSSTRGGGCVGVEVAAGPPERKEETSTVLSSPCGTARTKVVESESSRAYGVQSG